MPSVRTIFMSRASSVKPTRSQTQTSAQQHGASAIMLSISTAFRGGLKLGPSVPSTIKSGTFRGLDEHEQIKRVVGRLTKHDCFVVVKIDYIF